MAVSERLQKKYLADKFPESLQTENHVVVWFQNEDKYSIAEMKNIIEKDPKEKEMVTVKGIGSARWVGRALFIGTDVQCQKRLKAYEHMLDDQESDGSRCDNKSEQRNEKPNEKKSGSQKRKLPPILESDPEDDYDDVEPIASTLEKDVNTEASRVRNLLGKRSEIPQSKTNVQVKENVQVTVTEAFFKQLFRRLDSIQNTLDNILEKSSLESAPTRPHSFSTPPNKKTKHIDDNIIVLDKTSPRSSSPKVHELSMEVEDHVKDKEFNVGGINLLTDVPAKSKKPNLYATQLLSILFTDEEIRNGCVEPRDAHGKKEVLNQEKINLLKKCLNIKYGEKMQKNWSEIRQSLNQKCLDKRKQYLKKNSQVPKSEEKKEDIRNDRQDTDCEN